MRDIKIRKDNKKLLISFDIIFLVYTIGNFIAMGMNTMNIVTGYVLSGIFSFVVVAYLITYFIIRKKNIIVEAIDENSIPYYVSSYKHNKCNTRLILAFDCTNILFTVLVPVTFFMVLNFKEVYTRITAFVFIGVVLVEIAVLYKYFLIFHRPQRIEASDMTNTFSILDKKLLFLTIFILGIIYDFAIFTFDKPHFVVTYENLMLLEGSIALALVMMLATIFLTKIYYYYFDLKLIEQIDFSTVKKELIGKGKFAEVYKAYIKSLDQEYAIKKLVYLDESYIERFKQEFDFMKGLHHENLLQVYSYNEIDYEYLMDYMPYTLKDYIEKVHPNIEVKKYIVEQILNGMKYLHKHKILHRDLSKMNILIKDNESYPNEPLVKICDFGLCTKIDEELITRSKTDINSSIIDPILTKMKYYKEINDIYALGDIINYIYYESNDVKLDD